MSTTTVERKKPVHFEGRKATPCGRDVRMGANIFTTEQIGAVTCRKCLAKMKARAALAAELEGTRREAA